MDGVPSGAAPLIDDTVDDDRGAQAGNMPPPQRRPVVAPVGPRTSQAAPQVLPPKLATSADSSEVGS